MTSWNKYNNSLSINSYFNDTYDDFIKFLETLPTNINNEPFWDINDCEIKPISYTYTKPQDYIEGYIAIVKWLNTKDLNIKSGYAFVYQNENDSADTSVGGISSNNDDITICELDCYGSITHESYKILY